MTEFPEAGLKPIENQPNINLRLKMAYDFTADEMFQIAIKIEENGARFYQRAAALQSDPSNREVLRKLETMEKSHQKTFETMRSRLTDTERTTTVFDPAGEACLYLKAMADTHGGEGDPATADALTGKETMTEIVDHSCGVISIGPFGCMPSRVCEAILTETMTDEGKLEISNDEIVKKVLKTTKNLPFLSIESDGGPFPHIIEANFEAFCLQADRLHRKMIEARKSS